MPLKHNPRRQLGCGGCISRCPWASVFLVTLQVAAFGGSRDPLNGKRRGWWGNKTFPHRSLDVLTHKGLRR